MRRFLVWLCSFSLIFCVVSGAALAVEIPNIEDLNIDPWGDFDMISQSMGGVRPAPTSDDVYLMSDDIGIMPLSIDSGLSYSIALSGFAPSGNTDADFADEDGNYDDWDAIGVYKKYAPLLYVGSGLDSVATGSDHNALYYGAVKRPSAVVSGLSVSDLANWIGHPGIMNGDVNITRLGSVSSSNGDLYFRIDGIEPTEAVESITLQNFAFSCWPFYTTFPNPSSPNTFTYQFDGTRFNSAFLYINGTKYQELDVVQSGKVAVWGGHFKTVIENTTIEFATPRYVETVEIVLNFTLSPTRIIDCTGGFGVGVMCSENSANSDAKLVMYSDSSSQNTGLIKSILAFLQNIVDGITQLPGKIATVIMNGLKSLFIPDEDFLAQWKEDFFTMLKSKFGFIYQCFELLGDFFNDFVLGWGDVENYVFTVPTIDFTVFGDTYVLFEEQEISLDNPAMDILRPFAGTVVSIGFVLGFVHSMEDMFIAIISGWSYFSYLNREKEEDDT